MRYRQVDISGDALVVAFDICSSSDIMEELTLAGDIDRLKDFLTSLKRYLAEAQRTTPFDPYKFTGDGWILLFPGDTAGAAVLTFLRALSEFFRKEFQKQVLRHLATPPSITGLTFGIEKGRLMRLKMYGQREYIGWAINVACRLQNAVKDKGGSPAYKALVSNAAFDQYFAKAAKDLKVIKAKRVLRNIRGGVDFRCRKIQLLKAK
jgi:hypothetical protein